MFQPLPFSKILHTIKFRLIEGFIYIYRNCLNCRMVDIFTSEKDVEYVEMSVAASCCNKTVLTGFLWMSNHHHHEHQILL